MKSFQLATAGMLAVVAAVGTARAEFVVPGEYAPVEYVEGTGTQYVRTYYVPNAQTRIKAEYQLTQTGKSVNYLFGAYTRNSGWNETWYFWFSHTSKATVGYPGCGSTTKTLAYDLERHTLDFNCGTVAVDGNDLGFSLTWKDCWGTNPYDSAMPTLWLFARNPRNGGSDYYGISPMRIYSFQILEGDELKHDFVPVVRLADSVPGFYDRIGGNFHASAVDDPLVAGDYVSLGDDTLEIMAEPKEWGTPSPAYGTLTEVTPGTSFTVSAPAEVTRADGVTKMRCDGWKRYRLDATTHVWTYEDSGTETSFTYDPPTPAAPRKLVWQYTSYTISLTAGEHGTIEYDTGYHQDGEVVSVTVTPDDGYAFFKWNVAEGDIVKTDTDLAMKGPVRATAVFAPVIALNPGTDVISAAIAARLADVGDEPTVFQLAAGNYKESASNHAVWLTNCYHVVGMGSKPEDVIISRTASSANIFHLDHEDAEVRNVTVTGGYGATNANPTHGGNVTIGTLGGSLVDCVIRNGSVNTYNSTGGNIYMQGGLVCRCVVTNGYAYSEAGGIYASGTSRIENSLIGWNRTTKSTTAGVMLERLASIVNCTVVANGNNAAAYGGIRAYYAGTKVRNCAIFDNVVKEGGADTWGGLPDSFVNCASTTAINDWCIGTDSPAFKASAFGDYSLTVASPLRNAGLPYNIAGAKSAKDLARANRVAQSGVDIGAYEYQSSGLACDFIVDIAEALTPATVTFTATVEDAKGACTYYWDYDGDGTYDETTTVPTVSHTYTAGNYYTVGLKVSDGTTEATAEHENMVKTCQKDLYVKPAGEAGDEYPYASWETASDSVQDAIDAAVEGCVVHIGAGDYPITAAVSIKKNIRVEGATGDPDDVTIRATSRNTRVLYVDTSDSMFANCTLSGHYCKGSGRVFTFESAGGAISNCVIFGNKAVEESAADYSTASLAKTTRGLVTHCVFRGYCRCHLSGNYYGPCAITLNTSSRFENSLVEAMNPYGYSNEGGDGGTIIQALSGSSVRNVTVVNCTNNFRNAYLINVDSTSYFTNCVFCGNIYKDGTPITGVSGTTNNVGHCAFSEGDLVVATWKRASTSDFRDYAAGDYRPSVFGVLRDAGAAVELSSSTDLAGNRRVFGKAIDIGAYECQKIPGLRFILR